MYKLRYMDSFGSRLKSLRESRGWSQEKLGFELEITSATVSKWENGRSEPNLRHLEQLLRVFAKDGMSLDWLIVGKGGASKRPRPGTETSPRTADTLDEQALLARYRLLSAKKQRMLLGLIED